MYKYLVESNKELYQVLSKQPLWLSSKSLWLYANSYIQTLRTLYLYGILLSLSLFIAKRSALKRASQWSLKQMIISSSSWDISNLVFGNLVVTDWSAITQWILIVLRYFWYCLKDLIKGFWWPFRLSKSVKYFQSYGPNEVCDRMCISSMVQMTWVTLDKWDAKFWFHTPNVYLQPQVS